MKKTVGILLILCFCLVGTLHAQPLKEGHATLLAIRDVGDKQVGSAADLYLEITQGKGRVFMQTFPLTKFDTQISTRFAKDVACKYIDYDCTPFDFIYTIKADSSIIGGPSAGAALALLTVSLLTDIPLDDKVAVTGTINSGGLVGPVGGLKAKVEAAQEAGMTKVLIPQGKRFFKEEELLDLSFLPLNETNATQITITRNTTNITINRTNTTIDLVAYGVELGIEVVEVATLDDVFFEFTGQRLKDNGRELVISPEYSDTMGELAFLLCNRTQTLQAKVQPLLEVADLEENLSKRVSDLEKSALNLTKRAEASQEAGTHYATASFCFGANINYRSIDLYLRDLSLDQLQGLIKKAEQFVEVWDKQLDARELKTITDLQTYMIVKERLIEARDNFEESKESFEENPEHAIYLYSYGIERLYSAESWSHFFDAPGKEYALDEAFLKQSCQEKLFEGKEVFQYVRIYFPELLKETEKTLNRAETDLEQGRYALCLFKASQARAESAVILNLIGVEQEQLKNVLDTKLTVVKQNLVDQVEHGIFPILGYSYYEYADTLRDYDSSSALLYLEYAMELGNLDLYLEREQAVPETPKVKAVSLDKGQGLVFLSGLLLGAGVGILIMLTIRKKRR